MTVAQPGVRPGCAAASALLRARRASNEPTIMSSYVTELRVGNKYRLGRKIGSGSFGDIYLGKRASQEAGTSLVFFLSVVC